MPAKYTIINLLLPSWPQSSPLSCPPSRPLILSPLVYCVLFLSLTLRSSFVLFRFWNLELHTCTAYLLQTMIHIWGKNAIFKKINGAGTNSIKETCCSHVFLQGHKEWMWPFVFSSFFQACYWQSLDFSSLTGVLYFGSFIRFIVLHQYQPCHIDIEQVYCFLIIDNCTVLINIIFKIHFADHHKISL